MIRRESLFLLLLLLSSVVLAQVRPQLVDIPSYACLHTEKGQDTLRFPGNHVLFDSLYRALDTLYLLDRGRVNILHIGGSHVQAGYFTHRVRSHFTAEGRRVGNRGLLFPFKAMKTNAPIGYSMWSEGEWRAVRCLTREPDVPLGLSGACIETADSAARILFSLSSLAEWRTDTLRVLGESSSSGIVPQLVCQDDTLRPLPADEHSGYRFLLPAMGDTCSLVFPGLSSGSEVFRLRGLMLEGRESGVTYSGSGINGASVSSWLRCTKFTEELSLLPPSLVVLGLGINDANVLPQHFDTEQFKANYRLLIDRIRQVSPACCFIFITNNDCWFSFRGRRRQYNTNTPQVCQAMYELAREYDGAVFDVFSMMGGLRSSHAWVQAKMLRPDHIHFTREGYELWGDLLYNAIVKDYLYHTTSDGE